MTRTRTMSTRSPETRNKPNMANLKYEKETTAVFVIESYRRWFTEELGLRRHDREARERELSDEMPAALEVNHYASAIVASDEVVGTLS